MKPAVKTKPNLPARRDNGSTEIAPDFMRQDIGAGTENIDREDLDIPRLKLIQALSPEVEEFNQLRPGNFFHSASEHIFSKPFRAVPLFYDRQFILWNPRDSGGGILARAVDGIHWQPSHQEFKVKLDKKDGGAQVTWRTAKTVQESGLAAWGSMNPDDPNSAPAATRMLNFLLAFPDEPDLMPAVLTFQRSAIKGGRKFLTKIKTIRGPLYGMVFEFSSFTDTNRAGQDFHNVSVKGAGFLEDRDLYETYKGLYENYSQSGIQIKDVDTLQDDDPNGGEDDEAAPAKGARGGKATSGRPAY